MSSQHADRSPEENKRAAEAIRWLQRRLVADDLLDEIRKNGVHTAAPVPPEIEEAEERTTSPARRKRKGTVRTRPLGCGA